MKRVMLLSVAIVLCTALVASAAVTSMTASTTRTSYDASWDKLAFKLTGVTGGSLTPTLLSLLEGTWSAIGPGKVLALDGDMYSTNPSVTLKAWPPGLSAVNMATVNDSAAWNFAADNSSVFGSWYTALDSKRIRVADTTPADGIDQTLIANMYVSKGGDVKFKGQFGFSDNSNLYNYTISSAPVPEPGTFVLLATGLIGAVAMWIRRRRA